jgi:hypothetical protein
MQILLQLLSQILSDAVFSLFKTKSISANGTTELLSAPLILEESEDIKSDCSNS